jgi:deoxyadenosine/deoxycytidine kinase
MLKQAPCIISIEGNIGSGKSTLLANLQEKFKNIIFLREPVDEWDLIKDANGKTMLEIYYEDPKAHAFAFQMMAFISRLKLLKETVKQNPNAIIVTERCLYTDKMVFAKMSFDLGNIKTEHHQIYLQWFNEFVDDFPVEKIIYVKTNPEICHERILKRLREGEDNIPMEYLTKCDEYHDTMIEIQKEFFVDVLVLDGNTDIFENTNELNEWVNKIDSFIHNIHI